MKLNGKTFAFVAGAIIVAILGSAFLGNLVDRQMEKKSAPKKATADTEV